MDLLRNGYQAASSDHPLKSIHSQATTSDRSEVPLSKPMAATPYDGFRKIVHCLCPSILLGSMAMLAGPMPSHAAVPESESIRASSSQESSVQESSVQESIDVSASASDVFTSNVFTTAVFTTDTSRIDSVWLANSITSNSFMVSSSMGQGGSSQNATTVVLFVSPTIGNDATGTGSQRSPLRTLTHALNVAQAGTTIMLSSGTYSTETGEQFPIRLRQGITVYGNPSAQGEGVLIRGGGDFISPTATRQNIAILGVDEATLAGVTVTNPNHRGYGVWVESSSPTIIDSTLTGNQHDGVSVNGTSAPLIQGNHFYRNGANGVTVFGRSHPRIQANVFEQTGYGINVGDSAAPIILNNRIVDNRSGVVAQEQAQLTMRQNVISHNQQNGVVAIAQAHIDMGTAEAHGQNQFSSNGQHDINARVADYPVMAAGNQMDQNHVIGSVDFVAHHRPTTWTASLHSVPSTSADLLIPAVPLSAGTATEMIPTPFPTTALATAQLPTSQQRTASLPVQSSASPDDVQRPTRSPMLTVPQSVELSDATSTPIRVLPPANSPSAVQTQPEQPQGQTSSDAATAPSRDAHVETGTPVRILRTDSSRSVAVPSVLSLDSQAIAQFTDEQTELQEAGQALLSVNTDERAVPNSQQNSQSSQELSHTNRVPSLRLASSQPSQRLVRPAIAPSPVNPEATPIRVINPINITSSRTGIDTSDTRSTNSTATNSTSIATPQVVRRIRGTTTMPLQNTTTRLINPASINRASVQPESQVLSVVQATAAPSPTPTTSSEEEARGAIALPPNSDLLPVPSADVPQGHVGDISRVYVDDNPLQNQLALNSSGGRRLPLQYRVVVDPYLQPATVVQSIVPGAFQMWLNGRSFMQVGAFADLENASDLARQLATLGIRSEIYPIEN